MSYQLTKREARDADFLTLKSKSTGELVRIVSPHDFHVGIEGLKPSDVKVLGDVYITGSLYIKGGATGSMRLPDGTLAIEAGSGISVVENTSNGAITISTTGGGSGGAPDNAKYLLLEAYSPGSDLPNSVVLTAVGPLSFNSSTGEISLDSDLGSLNSLSVTSLSATSAAVSSLTVDGIDFSGMELITYGDGISGTGGQKVLTAGSGITVSDATVSVDSTVARTTGTTFTGDVNATRIISTKLSGSLTKLSSGNDYLIAGTNVTLTTGSDGSVTIAAPSIGGAPTDADYLVVGPTSVGSLSRERTLTMGAGLEYTDGGANGSYSIRVLDTAVPFLTGANFSGPLTASNFKSTDIFTTKITGSLTRLSNGDPYLVAGTNVSLSTGSNGSVTISAPSLVSNTSPFLLREYDASLPNSLILTHGAGIDIIEDGFGHFQVVADLVAGPGITITELPGGELEIAGAGTSTGGGGDLDAQYLVLSATGSLTAERVFTAGTGLSASDGGAGGSYTLSVRDDVFATISGSNFEGSVSFEVGLSGSLTQLPDGTSYLIAGPNVTIVSESNGAITISSTAGSFASYFTDPFAGILNTTGSLALAGGLGELYTTLDVGSDVFFFVSGSAGGRVEGTGTTVFGGDVVTSGGFYTEGLMQVTGPATLESNVTLGSLASDSLLVNSLSTFVADALFESSVFIGNSVTDRVEVTGSLDVLNAARFENGLSGSLTQLPDGTSYLRAGSNVTISTGSDGAVTISSTATAGFSSTLSMNEPVTGAQDGVNLTFVLAHEPSPPESLMLFYNGQLLTAPGDYTLTGDTVELSAGFIAPEADDVIRSFYSYSSIVPQYALNEPVSFSYDGSNWVADLANPPAPSSSLMLFMNGQLLTEGIGSDYLLSGTELTIEPGLFDVGASVFFATYQH